MSSSRNRRKSLFASVLLLALLPTPVFAGEAVKLDLVPKAQLGQGQPELIIHALVPLERIEFVGRRQSDGALIQHSRGSTRPGDSWRWPLEVKAVGPAQFKGELKLTTKGGESGSMPLDLTVELLPALVVDVRPEGVNLEEKRIHFRASRPVRRVELSLTSETGTPLGTTATDVEPERDGTYVFSWKQHPGTVLKMSLKAFDADDFFGGVELFPWRIDIPHEDVHFASGRSDIESSETRKLEASFKLIEEAIAKYGKLAKVSLFIAGHTDSVGSSSANRVLSMDRARAIARWFRNRGARLPISYQGFGEDLLLVETPDETDEPRNRRAEYIVAVVPPNMGVHSDWRELR